MKEVFGFTVLLAIVLDSDKHGALLGWAVVGSESEDTWRYILGSLSRHINELNDPATIIMSDCDKGLAAAEGAPPHAHHVYCSRTFLQISNQT